MASFLMRHMTIQIRIPRLESRGILVSRLSSCFACCDSFGVWLHLRLESRSIRQRSIKVKTRAREDKVEGPDINGIYLVHTKKPALEGKANAAVITLIASHFDVPKSKVMIKSGLSAKIKLVELTGL
jgi:uncharacterized protein